MRLPLQDLLYLPSSSTYSTTLFFQPHSYSRYLLTKFHRFPSTTYGVIDNSFGGTYEFPFCVFANICHVKMNFTCLYTFVIYLTSKGASRILKLSIESCLKDAQNDAFGLFVTKTSAEKLKNRNRRFFFTHPLHAKLDAIRYKITCQNL